MRGRGLRLLVTAGSIVLNLVTSESATAQSDVSNVPNRMCPYDLCALRMEGAHLVRGVHGERVGKISLFRFTRIEPLFMTPSDSAIGYARVFDRDYPTGVLMYWTGVIVSPAALAFVLKRREQDSRFATRDGVLIGVAIAGIALEFGGVKKMLRARRALSRAIWWNNRDLAR